MPFADFEASNQLVLDLNPAQSGTFGQIISMSSGIDYQSDEIVVATDFREFSAKILALLKAKNFILQEGIICQDFII